MLMVKVKFHVGGGAWVTVRFLVRHMEVIGLQ